MVGGLSINWWQWSVETPPVGWFLLDFAVFVGVVWYYVRKPLARAMAERHRRIKQGLADAEGLYTQAKSLADENRARLSQVEQEMKDLLERGRQTGASDRDQAVAEAKAFADRLHKDAEAIALAEQERARARLRIEAGRAALAQAQTMIQQGLSPEQQNELLEQAIEELEKSAAAARGPKTRGPSRAKQSDAGGAP